MLVFALSLPGVTARIYASDEIQFYAFLRSLWFDGDVSFENEYRHFHDTGVAGNDLFRETFLERTSDTGRRLNFGTLGSAILWAPFYGAADVGVRVARAVGDPVKRDGYSLPYIAAVCYGSALYGLLALLLSRAAARRVLEAAGFSASRAVTWATWAVWLGSPLVFYMYVAPAMSHATSAFAVALFVWTWLRVRDEWSAGGLVALGASAALMAMVREQDVFFVAGPAIDLGWTILAQRRWRLIVPAAAGAATCALTYLPQAAAYLALNGRVGPSSVTSRKMDWLSPHALDVLVSPRHGFFIWTPLAVLGLLGLVMLAARPRRGAAGHARGTALAQRLALCCGIMVALQVYVTGAVQSWTLAGAFGQRRFVALTVLLVIGLATAFTALATRRTRLAGALVVGICLWWNLGLIVQFGAGLMDRQHLDPAENAYNTFVTVPRRLPRLTYRYVFQRESFYRASPSADEPRDPR